VSAAGKSEPLRHYNSVAPENCEIQSPYHQGTRTFFLFIEKVTNFEATIDIIRDSTK